ncbi:uncharacterized protein LOC118470234 [Amphiprion ocellaris]|uniref:uncharacterized protein LOC118470234 n=1 Tax=Amphiprion ocellaris TaxID=80972 RepID=UPI002410EB68|nr:uncharacterized protein LOC118470234 [Amphiprion ocellaris]
MAGRLLLVVALCSFNVVKAGARPPPKLTVNPLRITETDLVTLNCVTPSSVSVSRCKFFIAMQETSKGLCVETLTATKLLEMTHKRSPAEVEVRCFYIEQLDAINFTSPDSETSTIIINNLLPPKLNVNPLVITETDSVTLDCQIPSSVNVSQCYFNIARRKPAFSCLKTLTGTELLSLAHQSSPATVEVTCFYLMTHKSPDSNVIPVSIETPRPELRVNPASVTETDSVTVNCVTPPSVSVTDCYLYFLSTKTPKVVSCLQTLTGNELLLMSHQSSPAEVEVKCFYTTGQYQSPYSYTSSIRVDVKSTTTQMTTFRTTTGLIAGISTDSVSLLSTSVTSVKPTSVSEGTDEASTDTLTSALFPVTPTNSSPETVSEGSDTSTTDILKCDVPCVTTTNSFLELRMLVVAACGFGVIVGVITLGVTVVCHKRRSEKSFPKRSQASMSGDFLSMSNIGHGGSLSADNTEAYRVISFVPAADRPTGFERVAGRESQNENAYHVYATIPEDPPAADLKDMTYSTIQPH